MRNGESTGPRKNSSGNARPQPATRKLNLPARLRESLWRTVRRILSADVLWSGALIMVVVLVLGVQRCGPEYERFEVGQRARSDIKAVDDFEFVDVRRTDEERRRQHELATGDVNGDGFTDLIALDAGEQMCEIFTISEAGRLLYATGFQVFESKIFSGGEPREYEPSDALVADVTGDGADDLVLLAHDRVLIYPQMTRPGAGPEGCHAPAQTELPE